MASQACYNTSFGYIRISYEDAAVTEIKSIACSRGGHCPSPVSDLAAAQLQEYFSGQRREFDFPTAPTGTPFQMAVWQALLQIPYGETCSYGQIAAAIGKPGASRAVGMACHKNPIWFAVPCHRVVGRNQALTGYAGGLDMKRALLALEQRNKL